MIKILLLLTSVFLSSNIFAAYFEVQPSGTSNILRSITFINNNTGVCVGASSTILRTTNGGANWINIDISNSATTYTCAAFANSTDGYIVSDDNELIKTTNGGLNWVISSLGSNPLKYIYFLNSAIGFIGGTNSALYKTTNGGNSWTVISLGINETIVRLNFYDENFGVLLTRQSLDSGSVYRTTNGGQNWIRYNNFYTGYTGQRALFDCVPLNKDTIYVSLGYYQTGIMRTTNCGENWQYIYNQFQTNIYPGSFYELFLIDRNNIIAMNGPTDGAPCYLVKSTNGGFNFTHPSAKRLTGYMYDGYFFRSSENAYMCGESGIIVKVYSYITGINNNAFQQSESEKQFTIYGNPTGETLQITSEPGRDNITSKYEFYVYNSIGQLMKTGNFSGDNYTMNISNLPSGIYYMRISASSKDYLKTKFVKIR